MREVKYVITKDNKVIIFSNLFLHSDFKRFDPIRAGFVQFGVDKKGNPTCSCYGESVSLGLSSNPEFDTELMMLHLGMEDMS